MANEFKVKNGLLVSGDVGATGSIYIGLTGSSGYRLDVGGNARISQNTLINGVTVGRSPGVLEATNHNIALGVNNYSSSYSGGSRAHIAIGYDSFKNLTGGYYSIAIGGYTLRNATLPDEVIGIGLDALGTATTPSYTIAIGNSALISDTNGYGNTVVGHYSGVDSNASLGGYGNNTFLGHRAARNLKNTQETVAIGSSALQGSGNNNLSDGNIAVGTFSAMSWLSGSKNIWLGYDTNGFRNGSNNVIIGGSLANNVIGSSTTLNDSIILANGAGSIRLFSPSTGNILVGTTTDAGYKLDVNGSLRSTSTTLLATSSGAVGIGTTGSGKNLTINKANASLEIRATNENESAYLYFGTPFANAGPPKAAIIAEGANTWSRNKLLFCLENTENNTSAAQANISHAKMVITRDGNVGIGTTGPAYRLDVNGLARFYGGSSAGAIFGSGSTFDLASDAYMLATSAGGNAGFIANRPSSSNFASFDMVTGANLSTGWSMQLRPGVTYWSLQDRASNTTVIAAFTTDNVGIGTTTDAGYKLDITGTLRSTGSAFFATSSGGVGIGTTSPGYNLDVNGGARVTLDLYIDRRLYVTDFLYLGTTTFSGYKLDVNGTARISNLIYTDTSNGRVGINTASPNFSFEVMSSNGKVLLRSNAEAQDIGLYFSTPFTPNNPPRAAIIGKALNNWNRIDLYFCSNNVVGSNPEVTTADARMVIQAAGNVGIGTVTPGYTLDVSGTLRSTSDTYLASAGAGNVGIGTTSPATRLDVRGGVYGNIFAGNQSGYNKPSLFRILTTDENWTYGSFSDDSTQYWMQVRFAGAGSSTRGFRVFDVNAGVTRFLVNGLGNFLINTTTDAGYRLDVSGTTRLNGNTTVVGGLSATNLTAGTATEYTSLDFAGIVMSRFFTYIRPDITLSRNLYFGGVSKGDIDWNLVSFKATTIDMFGNVGINTTSPESELQVRGTSPTVWIKDNGAGDTKLTFTNIGLQDWSVGVDRSDAAKFKIDASYLPIGSNTLLTIDTSGNVGIGSSSPTAKLDVNGSVKATGYIAQGATGYTGVLIIPGNPPGSQTITITGGIITAIN